MPEWDAVRICDYPLDPPEYHESVYDYIPEEDDEMTETTTTQDALVILEQSETYDKHAELNLVATRPNAADALNAALEIFRENEGRDITANDFLRITTPKGAAWEIPDSSKTAGVRYEEAIEGVPVFWKFSRTYYPGEYGESPVPSCVSVDGKTGIGNPGGNCATCPKSQFGNDGEAPSCRLRTEIYVLVPGALLPIVLVFSPANNKVWSEFKREMFHSHCLPLHRAMVRFELTPEKSANKREYMRIVPNFLGAIPDKFEDNLVTFKRALAAVLLEQNAGNVLEEEALDLADTISKATASWFVAVRGTILDGDDMRSYFLEKKTGMSSLGDVVRTLSASQYRELLIEAKHFARIRDGMTIEQIAANAAPVSDDEAREWLE